MTSLTNRQTGETRALTPVQHDRFFDNRCPLEWRKATPEEIIINQMANADPATWGSREIAEHTRKGIAQDAAKGKNDE